uniref:Uncharacterized protein n=1 Tax=Tanacetum cinerariifolium TaxID=118510 RepID=A0A6L2LY01_TANCI|nr:hypothetical protein [Tanacetum cinerariifolium]
MVTRCVRKGRVTLPGSLLHPILPVSWRGIFDSLIYFNKVVASEAEGLEKQKRYLVTMVISLVAKAER